MRLPRMRFTVRRMMIVVAFVGVLLAAGLEARWLHRKYREYVTRASIDSYGERLYREWAAWDIKREADLRSKVEKYWQGGLDDWALHMADYHGQKAAKFTLWADYHARMKAKYEAAARRPWLDVEPDPPEPPWPFDPPKFGPTLKPLPGFRSDLPGGEFSSRLPLGSPSDAALCSRPTPTNRPCA
jgi:hypothetical protein